MKREERNKAVSLTIVIVCIWALGFLFRTSFISYKYHPIVFENSEEQKVEKVEKVEKVKKKDYVFSTVIFKVEEEIEEQVQLKPAVQKEKRLKGISILVSDTEHLTTKELFHNSFITEDFNPQIGDPPIFKLSENSILVGDAPPLFARGFKGSL